MTTPPNLLLFMPDQLRADCVGAFGNDIVQTPNIDSLASRGTVFKEAYSQHSACTQSRVSMFTGLYPHVTGHRTLNHLLHPHEPNVFRSLKESGYHVAFAGARGDMMAPGVTEDSVSRFGFTRPPEPAALARFGPTVYPPEHRYYNVFYDGLYSEDLFDFDEATVQTAIDWLTDGLPEPWCLFIALMYPHPPFAVSEPWFSMHDRSAVPSPTPPRATGEPRYMQAIRDRYELDRMDESDWRELIATYYGMISRVDDQFGQVMSAVNAAGLDDRTVTFFLTDHGEYLGDFGLIEKWMSGLDDCLLHNPLIVHDPAARASETSTFVELIDLAPTLLDYAGVDSQHLQFGRSLRPVVLDPTRDHRDAAFSEGGVNSNEVHLLDSVEGGPYQHKLALQNEDTTLLGRAISVRTQDWVYIERLYEPAELYDRHNDPDGTTNVAHVPENADACRELKDRIFAWLLETSDVSSSTVDERLDPALVASFVEDLNNN